MSETIVFSARKIITMNPNQATATHVAVRDGRILAVGNLEQASSWGDFKLDERFAEKVLMPGLVEGHSHAKAGGMWKDAYIGWFDRCDPDGQKWPGSQSMEDIIINLKKTASRMNVENVAHDIPLVAWGFDPIYFKGGARMTIEHLDKVSTERPILVAHSNGHVMNVNTVVLKNCGITQDISVEGLIKFENEPHVGEPTGELKEFAAMFLALRKFPQAGLTTNLESNDVRNFARLACRAGVTTATDLLNPLSEADCDALETITRADDCNLRILPALMAIPGGAQADSGVKRLKELETSSTEKLRYGLVKMMLDGSIQGFSGRLRWPGYYNGAPNGIWVTDPAQYEENFEIYHKAGLLIHTHTNADEASEVAINAIERVLTRVPRPDHRHTLQHGQMMDRPMFKRMKELGLCANLFANHIWYWGDQHYEITMGPDRANRMDACGTALSEGVPLAIHSDAPVTPLGPLFTAWCAVNRITPSGRVLGRQECITVDQALRAITLGAAWTLKMDHEVGSIECGKLADFCVLEEDPYAVPSIHLKDIPIWGTVLGGRVFAAESI